MRVQRSLPTPAEQVAADPSVQRTLAYEPALDGLRGVSIVAVVLFHAGATSGLPQWFRGGALGVSVFFTLSGFLITTVLLREVAATGRVNLRRFWARRIRRLVPASLAVVGAVVVLSWTTNLFEVRAREVAATVLSFANWNIVAGGDDGLLRTVLGPLGPTWSLSVEEQFYVALAIVVVLCTRARRPQRALALVFIAVVAASLVLSNVVSDCHARLEFGTDLRAAELAIGGLLAVAVTTWGARLPERRIVADAIGAAGLAVLAVLFMTADYTPPWLLRGGFSAVAVVSSAVILGALAHRGASRLLGARPLVAVGRWSYSIYLVHWPLFLALSEDRVGVGSWALLVVKCAAATLVGVGLHVLIERPFRRQPSSTVSCSPPRARST